MIIDGIDILLMTPLVGGDEAEVICIRKSDEPLVFQTITILLLFLFE